MQLPKKFQRVAIAVGIGVAAIGGLAYWYLNRQHWCVRTMSISGKAVGGQEVVYSWGCIRPQRFRQWSVTATADRTIRHAGLIKLETSKNNESLQNAKLKVAKPYQKAV